MVAVPNVVATRLLSRPVSDDDTLSRVLASLRRSLAADTIAAAVGEGVYDDLDVVLGPYPSPPSARTGTIAPASARRPPRSSRPCRIWCSPIRWTRRCGCSTRAPNSRPQKPSAGTCAAWPWRSWRSWT
ncbi:hypothetical protein [Streptomyces sudanensis]|uniref:hypothetical protein n=1 Tax=Streptomyces sudanensis TaxID=436397 RepID=UPI0020CD0ED1|nr:hypothetical protein [Streptomyces sudanensis]MCP9957427.1 hypothetical protein [Streptomyces sudanensis]MCQ0002025.1 hypothetical protein [Streptomyces sudanensis]